MEPGLAHVTAGSAGLPRGFAAANRRHASGCASEKLDGRELEAEVYRLCDTAQTPAAISKQIAARRDGEVSVEEVKTAIQTLCDAKVLLPINGKLLGLGLS
jgi:hypothetical protein